MGRAPLPQNMRKENWFVMENLTERKIFVVENNPSYGLSALKSKETRHPRAGGGPGDWVINLDSCDPGCPPSVSAKRLRRDWAQRRAVALA